MKIVAWVGAVIIFAGLIVLAVAGIEGATAILVTAAALVTMVVLGGKMGGRHTPNVTPVPTSEPLASPRASPPAEPTAGPTAES